ncbi:MAG: SDR family NAD(P)-dependent oxidoreductase [Rhodospirillum sp.]|nr:SDR family NAD(P)-dependent oxidoreductase [Rhodospirillum sp.]MCF8490694.1 SDR family NAD(P)-dependent oxidoreductase [Rhodospirillum sp.]MCF8499407.1 SDR family NAD(P)-dependent oxidoreductase [Rhodospirillum sp.]
MTKPRTATPRDGCAWVTGAASGMGAALALLLARNGWTVAASDRREDGLARVVAQASPGRIQAFALDITDAAAVAGIVPTIEERMGPVALAVLNAGILELMTAETFSVAVVRAQVETNLMGTVHCIEAVLPRLLLRGRGQLALTASMGTYRGLPRMGAYGASKAGLVSLAESLKFDLDPAGVRIQVINPGVVRTPILADCPSPIPYQISAETAARRIVAGLGTHHFEISFPRPVVLAAKVLRALPDWLYYRLLH